ncbi:MAG: AsmA family protein [Deltaproteobacteria bacterium]|nr:AsmA family protein [Deltaproteobacteria bacterium]
MNEQPSPDRRPKRWKWILGIAAIVVLFFTFALLVILSNLDFNRLKPLLIQVVKQETGRNLEIRGAMDLKLGLRPSLVMDDVLFQNAPGGATPEMVKIKRLEAEVLVLPLLNKEIRITRLVLLEPDFLIERDKSGRWNFEFEKPETFPQKDAPPQGFPLPRIGFQQVQVEKGRVSYPDEESGTLCCLSLDLFTASSESMESPVVLAFSGSYKEKPIELRGTVGSLLLLKEPGRGYPVDLIAKAAGAQLKVKGTIHDILNLRGLSLKASAEVQSTSQMAAFLGESLPVEFGPLQATAAISDAGVKIYNLSDLRVSSKAGDAGGSLTVGLDGPRPKLSGSVACQRLNLNPFLNGGKTRQARADASTGRNRIFPNDPLPLDILKQVDVQLKFEAREVQLPALPLGNLSAEVRIKDGLLVLRPIQFKAGGGDAEGRAEMHAQGRAATAKAIFKVNQMDLRLLSSEWKAEGKVDVDLDLLARGSTIAGLMAGLNGRTVVVMGQGRVDNKSIQILGGDLASGGYKLLNPSSKDATYTDINCGVGGFDIKDGMAKVTALVVDTPDMTVIGEGQVNLRDETLDLALKPYPKGGAAGLSLSFGELAKSFRLGGTLANPSLQIDAGQTMLAAGKAAGGVLLFGPAGIAAALAGQSLGEGDPCLAALESAKKGVGASESGKGGEQKGTEYKGLSGTLKGVGESVKKLFSGQGTLPPSDNRSNPYGGGGH